MKALVLVGGKGTRLQPLTYTVPKPMVPLMNRPFLEHMIGWLCRNGVDEVILTTGYLPEAIEQYFQDGRRCGVRITYVVEDTPLDTGGAIKNCEAMLRGEPFLVVNGDILTDLDLTGIYRLHADRGALVTVAAARVADPTPYGMLQTAPDGRLERWVEKPRPEQVTSHHVNVGAFFFRPDALAMMPPPPFNLERQFLAPAIMDGQPVYGYRTDCYWIDIGTAAKYRQAHLDALGGRIHVDMPGCQIAPGVWGPPGLELQGVQLYPPVLLGEDCRLGAGGQFGPQTVLCDRVTIGPHVRVTGSVIWPEAVIGEGSRLTDCVIGTGYEVPPGSRLEEAVLGRE